MSLKETPPAAASGPDGGGAAANGSGGGALAVASGIFASRIAGFLRDRAIAHYFGVGPHADVFGTALRGPNLLQNLLGEQSLSASFIPVYARLLAAGRRAEATRFAGAIFSLLLAAAGALSLIGLLLARPVVAIFAAGYLRDAAQVAAGQVSVDRYELAVSAVRWIFPMTGLLVLSAWALGVLNCHRRFFLPYFAPVIWNATIIGVLVAAAHGPLAPWFAGWLGGPAASAADRLLLAACVGALVGGAFQLAVQLPSVLRLLHGLQLTFSWRITGVREALAAFVPAVGGRGVLQLSSYVEQLLASLLAAGAVGALRYAQTLYLLPVSLFGVSLAASALPELSGAHGEQAEGRMVARLETSLRQAAFLNLPTTLVYLAFGWFVVGAVYRTGDFDVASNWLVFLVVAAFALGLPATIWSRLLQAAFFALGDTKTPARVSALRMAVASLLGVPLMVAFDRQRLPDLAPGATPLYLGAVGLALAASVAAWFEQRALRRALRARLPELRLPWAAAARISLASGIALLPAALVAWFLPVAWHVALRAALVLGLFGLVYLGAGLALDLPEARAAWESARRLRRRT